VGVLCLLPALVLLFAVSLTRNVVMDAGTRTMTLTRVYLLGVGQWSRQRERTINFSSITQAEYKTNWLGSARRVEMSTMEGQQIILQFGTREDEAKRAASKIAELLGPSAAPGIELEEVEELPASPVTGWRLGLASIYGLVAALALGYLWFLLVTATSAKIGFAALVLGLLVGIVVSFMGGGNKDVRYAALGAVLSGVGIAFGEFLIFGLPDSEFLYEFDFVDLLIYAVAIYEGWTIPRRSIPLVRQRSHLIHEDNRTPILAVGTAALVLLLGFTAVTGRLPSPESTEAKIHYDRATQLVEDGKLEEAIVEYQDAIRLKPDYALAHNDLGAVYYYGMGLLADAEAEFEKAIQSDPNLALVHANLANVYDDQGRYDEGINEVNEALRPDPSLPLAHLVSGYINANLGNAAEAQAAFEKTIELDPSVPDAHFMLGLLQIDKGNWGLAVENFSRALDMEMLPLDMSVVYAFRGLAHGSMSSYEDALADVDEAIRMESSNAFAYYVRGLVYVDLGERENAISDLERALELGLELDAKQVAEAYLDELGQ
jgi:tetratricopeptide (TPR) repeat protein